MQNTNVNGKQKAPFALRIIKGIGRRFAILTLKIAQIDVNRRAGELTEDEVSRITNHLDKNYIVEGPLRRKVQQEIGRLREIQCYRGVRHRKGLPVGGQRTKNNARTRKGRKKTVVGKKGVKDKKK